MGNSGCKDARKYLLLGGEQKQRRKGWESRGEGKDMMINIKGSSCRIIKWKMGQYSVKPESTKS